MIRTIADGYALLSGSWTAAENGSLPLPHHAEAERQALIQKQHVDDWPTGEGHPLSLGASVAERPQQPTPPDEPTARSGTANVSTSVMRDLPKCLYLFELARVLSESALGREALRYKKFSAVSISYLRFALEWNRQILREGCEDGRTGVSVACWLIAEGLFAITHSESGSAPQLFPHETSLRELLQETGGYAWLIEYNVSMPAWAEVEDD